MGIHDPRHDGEPEPYPTGGAAASLVGAGKGLEDTTLLIRGHARAVIFHDEPLRLDIRLAADPHPRLGVAHGVAQEVVESTGEGARVGVQHEVCGLHRLDLDRWILLLVPGHDATTGAGVRVPAADRSRLERLCRYAARGPLATERLSCTPDGDVYRLRRRWRDGTVALRFSPDELIEKLCALVPPPRFNLTRFHGVLAPNHRLRALVVPGVPPDENQTPAPEQLRLFGNDGRPRKTKRRDGKPRAEPRPRMPWAQLLKRTFGVDVLGL